MKKPYRDWSHDDDEAPTGKGGAIMACMLIAVVAALVAWNWDRIFNFFLP